MRALLLATAASLTLSMALPPAMAGPAFAQQGARVLDDMDDAGRWEASASTDIVSRVPISMIG